MIQPTAPELESALSEALERQWAGIDGTAPGNLRTAVTYSLLAPGKRIRPRLLISCAGMLGLPLEKVLSAALALEMVHCFTLIHDDLPCMDDDDFRRGMPSNHKKFGEGLALLAGDALMAIAVDTYLESMAHFEASRVLSGMKKLSWCMGPRGVIGGQSAELLLTAESTLNEMRQMHAQKTGSLFSAALLIPRDFAGISEESSEGLALAAFARELGLAFQTTDDLEDADEELKPTSILFFMGKREARDMTVQQLGSAAHSLVSTYGEASKPLIQISDEVIRRLEKLVNG